MEKNENKNSYLPLILAMIIITAVIVVAFFVLNKEEEKKEDPQSNSSSNSGSNEKDKVDYDMMMGWCGLYEFQTENRYVTIQITATGDNQITFDITDVNDGRMSGTDIEVTSSETLYIDETVLEDTRSATITKTEDGIHVGATSIDPTSLFNLNTDFVKVSYNDVGLNGVYKEGNTIVYITQMNDKYGYISTVSDSSVSSLYFEIDEGSYKLDEGEIIKTSNGIKVNNKEYKKIK